MSQKTLLLLPLIGMFWLTVGIALWVLKLRYRAVLKDGVNPAYFKLNKGAKLPNYLIKVTQHFENIFEMPPLFYVSIILVMTLDLSDTGYVVLSWLYLLFRFVHAYIHTTYNYVPHRRNAFIMSAIVLILIWARLTVDVLMMG
ncbi:MAG: MAPEG family protein [Cocleimonas sp.]